MDRLRIRNFTDLIVWQKGHALALAVYSSTKAFPKDELFSLTNQIRRAAVSVTSNIAEGFSRRSKADKRHFYTISAGSLTELQSQLLLARDLGYLPQDVSRTVLIRLEEVHRLCNALISSTDRANF